MKSRKTKQKEEIRKEIEKINGFFTAEELYHKLNGKISIATIYRFLKNLKEIHSYTCNRRTIYSKGKNSHCHFICEKCDETSHIKIDKLDFIKPKISGEICHFQIDVHGICKKCQNSL